MNELTDRETGREIMSWVGGLEGRRRVDDAVFLRI